MKAISRGIILALCAAACAGTLASMHWQVSNPRRVHQLKSLKVVKISASNHIIDSWVMDNDQKREEGMMFLTDKEVKSNQGMIFVFDTVQPNNGQHAFWMHNTLIPLDVIYISAAKKVVSISTGKVEDDTPLLPKGAYKFVLELKGGLAKKLGIKPGTRLNIPASVFAID